MKASVRKPKTKKPSKVDRAYVAANFARFAIETDGSFIDVEVVNGGEGDPDHEHGGSCWITVRVLVADVTIEEQLARQAVRS